MQEQPELVQRVTRNAHAMRKLLRTIDGLQVVLLSVTTCLCRIRVHVVWSHDSNMHGPPHMTESATICDIIMSCLMSKRAANLGKLSAVVQVLSVSTSQASHCNGSGKRSLTASDDYKLIISNL